MQARNGQPGAEYQSRGPVRNVDELIDQSSEATAFVVQGLPEKRISCANSAQGEARAPHNILQRSGMISFSRVGPAFGGLQTPQWITNTPLAFEVHHKLSLEESQKWSSVITLAVTFTVGWQPLDHCK